MARYTTQFTEQMIMLSPLDNDYEKKLIEISSAFKDFGNALTDFLAVHGYCGDPDSAVEKAQYLKNCYRAAGITNLPRDFKKWFAPECRLKRETVFPLIFALKLDLQAAEDFFRKVQFERSFDCHTASEAIYYYCIKNSLSYSDAEAAIQKISSGKRKSVPDENILYTITIKGFLDRAENLSQVAEYITKYRCDFDYNNTTAGKMIQKQWSLISGKNGLAAKEGKLINSCMNQQKKDPINNRRKPFITLDQMREEEFLGEEFAAADDSASTWTIYAQILGLDQYTVDKYAAKRSFSPVFNHNALLPLRAADCFPSRQSIDAILRGKSMDHEVFRKALILLDFYAWWAERLTEKEDLFLLASKEDRDECLDYMNMALTDAGFPELYAGNPYDWIFLWALQDEMPLASFRFYIGEVFALYSETEK